MKRRYRIIVALAVVAGSFGAILLLTSLSVGSRGPLSGVIERMGAGIGAVEYAIRRRLVGPGRAGDLAWVERYRQDISLLRRPDSVLLGAYEGGMPASLEGIGGLERGIGLHLPIIQAYSAWGDKPDQRFPLRLVRAIWDYGSIPMITWEPWLTDFENSLHPQLPLRDVRERGGMATVAGGQYDFYIDAWAAEAAEFGKPLLIRFGHEMNDPYRYPWGPQNNTKEDFIAAWRHVVDRFRAAGADKVLWVWSPHVAYEYWELYYPGDEYVDWTATGVLNYGPIAQWSDWWTLADMIDTRYATLEAFGKPLMLAEFGSLSVGGDRATWYRDALVDLPTKYPAVKAVLFFEVGRDQTITYQTLDWTVASDTIIARVVREAARPWAPGPDARAAVTDRRSPRR